jgi:hypothetical protein
LVLDWNWSQVILNSCAEKRLDCIQQVVNVMERTGKLCLATRAGQVVTKTAHSFERVALRRVFAIGILMTWIGMQALEAQSTTACAKWINADASNSGTVAWQNLPGAQCDPDENRAMSGNASGNVHTQYLRFNNFGIQLPDECTISGIELTLVRRSLAGNAVSDRTVQLLRNGMPVGHNQRYAQIWEAEWTGATYGGPLDTWGQKWTAAELRSPGFGLLFDASIQGPEDRAEIDQVLMTVYFQQPGLASRSNLPTTKFVCGSFSPAP